MCVPLPKTPKTVKRLRSSVCYKTCREKKSLKSKSLRTLLQGTVLLNITLRGTQNKNIVVAFRNITSGFSKEIKILKDLVFKFRKVYQLTV